MTTSTRESAAPGSLVRSGPAVRIQNVRKDFGRGKDQMSALDGVDMTIDGGEFVCLVGASGCGKSTLLNLIADLDQPTTGTVDVGGRKVAFMFQDATLLPWLTAGQNIELALKLRGISKEERKARVRNLMDLVHLGGRADKRPHELSGGMRQRTSLARVLAQEADIVLMDEPFAALDAMTRDVMHDEVERIYEELGLTIVFVTHNVREAVRLSSRTILMSSSPGRVLKEFDFSSMPRPRRIDDPVVAAMSGELTDELKTEVAKHVR
jgi:NitT/TauT family transport system ATP-binding protein